jgi:hypothetical protein
LQAFGFLAKSAAAQAEEYSQNIFEEHDAERVRQKKPLDPPPG